MTTSTDTPNPPAITPRSLDLFLSFVEDAGNWSGTPLASISAADRGNLTQLKRAGLLTTFDYEGDPFVQFTEAGVRLAAEHGHDIAYAL